MISPFSAHGCPTLASVLCISGSFRCSLLLLRLLCGESLCHWEAGALSWPLLCPCVCKLGQR